MKKRYLFLIGLILLCIFFLKNNKDTPFVKISSELVKNSFEKDTLSASFSFQDPEQFGLTRGTVSLPLYDREDYLSSHLTVADAIASLEKIDPQQLSEKAKSTYETLLPYLKMQLKAANFPYYEEPLSPTGGIHISLPVLLAEYPVTHEEDLKEYLSLLTLIPSYFDSLADFESDKAAEGMFLASEDTDQVISQCDFFASEKGKSFFRESFKLTLKQLFSEEDPEFDNYMKEHDRILEEKVLPAYRKLGDSMELLKENRKERRGLSQYKNGAAYYEYLLQRSIGTDSTTAEIEKKLCNRLEKLYQKLALLQDGLKEDFSLETSRRQIPVSSCLPVIQERMKSLFPSFSPGSHVQIKEIPDSLANFTAPAYYFTPNICICPPGDISEIKNVIYVGKDIMKDPVNLFTTMAHEGYPGHMYQNIFFLSSQGVSEKNVLRYCMNFPGYSEGWAMYVELLSYSHAGNDKISMEMLRLSREIQICLLCILDIRIHAGGAGARDIAPYLAHLGIREPADVEHVFSYLINEPGTYLQYYGGYLELLECKKLYREKCIQSKVPYSDLEFHTFFLSHGPDSYTNIKKKLK